MVLFIYKGNKFKKSNACDPVTPEASPGDPLLWKRLDNLEKFTEKEFEHRGIAWAARMELVRESVGQLIAENDTLQAGRDNRTAMKIVRAVENALDEVCPSKCGKVAREYAQLGQVHYVDICYTWKSPEFDQKFSYTNSRLQDSNACEDEATWEETENDSFGNPLW
jgi:hypothetical protein